MFVTTLKAILNGWLLTVYNNLDCTEVFYERLQDAQEARTHAENKYEYGQLQDKVCSL